MSADVIGQALNGRRNGGGWLVRCPCPNHGKGRGDRNPSLSVADGDDERLLLRCFAGCDFLEILDELKRKGLVDSEPRISGHFVRKPDVVEKKQEPDPEALRLWKNSIPASDTIASEYLERRGIVGPPPASLRYLPDAGAMVAAVQNPEGVVCAIQTLRLSVQGDKILPRITTGPLGGGAVRLGLAGRVLGLSEGVETGLSAMQMTGVPVWASLGAGRLHRVEVPAHVEEIDIFVDNDEPGRTAAKRTAEVHIAAGRSVRLRSPPDQCKDWNDFLNLIADRDGRDMGAA
ncbi:toprim domain-containing protein [Bradyrhizobium liaoningense]|uniref:toprim domain-containing protein n=1 Tax=Bradyrhizobium liaoningense TaxID=43992 RepID=UPI001BA5DC17|nr:toprim domain-containing protein [Bradyrhizobium liaoningense]MBR0880984.1 toprim domain-containing protein [Bradyrhizobium liaoningense]